MSTTHTTWQGAVAQSNKKEQARVSHKYPGTKKISSRPDLSDDESDPFGENDSILSMGPTRSHNAKQYAKASGLPLSKAKKILKETDTLQK